MGLGGESSRNAGGAGPGALGRGGNHAWWAQRGAHRSRPRAQARGEVCADRDEPARLPALPSHVDTSTMEATPLSRSPWQPPCPTWPAPANQKPPVSLRAGREPGRKMAPGSMRPSSLRGRCPRRAGAERLPGVRGGARARGPRVSAHDGPGASRRPQGPPRATSQARVEMLGLRPARAACVPGHVSPSCRGRVCALTSGSTCPAPCPVPLSALLSLQVRP